MGPIKQEIRIGEDIDAPIVAFSNINFPVGSVVCTQYVNFIGRELAIDDLTADVQVDQRGIGNGLLEFDGKALYSTDGKRLLEALRTTSKGEVLTGRVLAFTQDGDMLFEANGERIVFPDTGNIADILQGVLDGIRYRTPVWYIVGETTRKFYWKSSKRTGKYRFHLEAVSEIGILDKIQDYGGIYVNEPMGNVLKGIMSNAGFRCAISPDVASMLVTGWLPIQSARKNLQQLIAGYGFVIRRGKDYNIYFTVPDNEEIETKRLFLGGTISPMQEQKYYKFEIAVHAFTKTDYDREITLFNNSDNTYSIEAERTMVVFSQAPIYALRAEEFLSIEESGANYAIVSGTGILIGRPYTHTTHIIELEGNANAEPDNVLRVDDVSVINPSNGMITALRLRDFYNQSEKVEADFIQSEQTAGDFVRFPSPYGGEKTGYITSTESRATSFIRASAEIISGFKGEYCGNYYIYSTKFTGTGQWIVPQSFDGSLVMAVLIGGGGGGASGEHGKETEYESGTQEVTIEGGNPGEGGSAGKIKIIEFTPQPGEVYDFQCGAGGARGIASDEVYVDEENKRQYYSSTPGSAGEVTTFGPYSTEKAYPRKNGYIDFITQEHYAVPGVQGIAGGESGPEEGDNTWETQENVKTAIENGKNTTVIVPSTVGRILPEGVTGPNGISYQAGAYGDAHYKIFTWEGKKRKSLSWGGSGGGAAVGANGDVGGDAEDLESGNSDKGGYGGDGANAASIFGSLNNGSGGSGGHGGGEGGKGGSVESYAGDILKPGSHGKGGAGSDGQDGADGCILLFTRKPVNESSVTIIQSGDTPGGNPGDDEPDEPRDPYVYVVYPITKSLSMNQSGYAYLYVDFGNSGRTNASWVIYTSSANVKNQYSIASNGTIARCPWQTVDGAPIRLQIKRTGTKASSSYFGSNFLVQIVDDDGENPMELPFSWRESNINLSTIGVTVLTPATDEGDYAYLYISFGDSGMTSVQSIRYTDASGNERGGSEFLYVPDYLVSDNGAFARVLYSEALSNARNLRVRLSNGSSTLDLPFDVKKRGYLL